MPDGSVMLTHADTISGERHSLTLKPSTAYQGHAYVSRLARNVFI
jgi:hypothetical protein